MIKQARERLKERSSSLFWSLHKTSNYCYCYCIHIPKEKRKAKKRKKLKKNIKKAFNY